MSANIGLKGGNNNEGFNFSQNQTEIILPNDIMRFKVGEMLGICEKTKQPTFHLEVERNIFETPTGKNGNYDEAGKFHTSEREIPAFNQNIDVSLIAEKIKWECKMILASELPTNQK